MKHLRYLACLALTALGTVPTHAASLTLMSEVADNAPVAQLRAQANEMVEIYVAMATQAGVEAKLFYSPDPEVNAFATEIEGEKIIVVQKGLIELLKDDRDAIAVVLGHELAHHQLDHVNAGRRKKEGVRALGGFLGALAGAAIGHQTGSIAVGDIANSTVNAGAGLLALKFNRNQEMKADQASLNWVMAAGYNPNAMLRLQHRMAELKGNGRRRSAMLSTHPTSKKRYQAAERQLAKLSVSPDVLNRPMIALASDEKAVASTDRTPASSIASQDEATTSTPQPIASSASIELEDIGLTLAEYAALSNEMLYLGPGQMRKLLARHNLTSDEWQAADAGMRERMRTHAETSRAYAVAYYRASRGRMAAYGNDIADSFEKNQAPAAEQPPFELDTQLAMQAALRPYENKPMNAALRKQMDQALKSYDATFYDYTLSKMWWSRTSAWAAMQGDRTLMDKMNGATASIMQGASR